MCWQEVRHDYYVAREIARLHDKEEQRFVKDRTAVEVQFGKYFSVSAAILT